MAGKRKTGVEGVHIVRVQRIGKPIRWYIYAWRGGPRVRICIGPEKPKLVTGDLKAIAAAYEAAKPENKGDLRALIAKYRSTANPEWRRLSDSTKKLWGRCLDVILVKWGDVPYRLWDNPRMTPLIVKWRDEMQDTPRAADNRIACLRRVLAYGRLNGYVSVNAAEAIPTLYRGKCRAEIIWTNDDLERMQKVAREGVWDAVRLASMTGLRRADLVALTWDEIKFGTIERVADKMSRGRRRKVVIPIIPALRDLLEELRGRYRREGVNHVLVNQRGLPWTGDGFETSFGEDRNRAGITYEDEHGATRTKHLHDLRGTFVTRLLSEVQPRPNIHDIADIMGWTVQQVDEIRRAYVDTAAIITAIGDRMANVFVK